ncbi:ribonuclease P protein component [Propionivibrio sp.]|uniref:ribonuclease P protein component n=1 Tax=Propionivibrio sp. TaxID=2212460 RepID=UPI00272E1CE8|nr:ribonuclease P protein component [Propionivibrio sp.]
MSDFPLNGQRRGQSEAFPKSYRLTKTDDFSSVFSFRKTIRGSCFLLHYRPRDGESEAGARLGLVVAKRFLRRSVDRNLVRRLVREVFRKQHADLPARDLIVRLACKPSLPLDRRILSEEVRNLLERMRTIGRRP